MGEACTALNQCGPGSVCGVLDHCGGGGCCIEFCDVDDPTTCDGVCEAFFNRSPDECYDRLGLCTPDDG